MTLNQRTFRNGENIEIKIDATKDCYITLLNLYSNSSLLVLFPDQHSPNNFVQAGQTLVLPPPESNYFWPVNLAPGADSDLESFLAIATRKNVPFTAEKAVVNDEFVKLDDALMTINNWLVKFHADERTTSHVHYRIVR